jgi:hypothetical protein
VRGAELPRVRGRVTTDAAVDRDARLDGAVTGGIGCDVAVTGGVRLEVGVTGGVRVVDEDGAMVAAGVRV